MKTSLELKEDPTLFQLEAGKDHIEIQVKTVNLGDQVTPGTTIASGNASGNRNSNRLSGSGRRGTVMINTPFIP